MCKRGLRRNRDRKKTFYTHSNTHTQNAILFHTHLQTNPPVAFRGGWPLAAVAPLAAAAAPVPHAAAAGASAGVERRGGGRGRVQCGGVGAAWVWLVVNVRESCEWGGAQAGACWLSWLARPRSH